jgi:K+-sensing histidine kinase KdpD
VAAAFETAQRTAVQAAMTEAKTRESVKAAFVNLAHRSHLLAHRQLEVLDAAEAKEEAPESLELLFRLDHLATRARRNAENLILLGGERPGRQWRNPVPLRDVVRGAIAEANDYARVVVMRMPEADVIGAVVADVTHLLAELVDNATFFSPRESQVEVSGSLVGKGAVVEIIDQGLGLPETDLARINDLLADGPQFELLQLSSDSRLGLTVVSMLASRNGVRVRLSESDYGGIKVVVLIPTALLVLGEILAVSDDALGGGTADGADIVRPRLPRRQRQESLSPQLAVHVSPPSPTNSSRSAEQARDLMAAIAAGTRQGRQRPSDIDNHPGRTS